MPKMKVKDLIAALQEIDPELEIYRFNSISCKPIFLDYAGYTFAKVNIAKWRDHGDFYSLTSDAFYNNNKYKFEPPYEVVMIY